MLPKSIIWLVCSLLASNVIADEEVTLDIPQGKLKGIKSTTVLNETPFYSFLGVPYAKAVDAESKFKAAEPPEPWSGVYDATQQRSGCVSFCMIRQMVVGDDNCLFVNVYTPELNKNARKAVLVFIHGGGFNMGSADRDIYGLDFLVEQDVVLVTMTYRLGAFGFLGTEDSAAPGNVGLKDQTAALKWVQDNIQYFGGCPHRVTIFGQSAGSASVQFHLISPMSAGLFSKAIMQSGSTLASWAITYHPKKAAFLLGEALNIRTTDSAELVKELAQIPSPEIVKAAMEVDATEKRWNGHWNAFVPCVEPDAGQEIFLPADPWELIKTGKIADVPYMGGLNLNETLFVTDVLFAAPDQLNEHFETVVPDEFNVTDAAQQKQIADSIRKFYLGDAQITKDSAPEYGQMMMDILFTYGMQMSLTIMDSLKSSPTYNYLFTYESPLGLYKDLKLYDGKEGVIHGDELGYMFFARAVRSKPEPGSPEEKLTHVFTKLWTNFAKTGNPTSTLDDDVTVNWEPMEKENNYLIINKDLSMSKNMLKERIDFWVSLFKDIIGDYASLF